MAVAQVGAVEVAGVDMVAVAAQAGAVVGADMVVEAEATQEAEGQATAGAAARAGVEWGPGSSLEQIRIPCPGRLFRSFRQAHPTINRFCINSQLAQEAL